MASAFETFDMVLHRFPVPPPPMNEVQIYLNKPLPSPPRLTTSVSEPLIPDLPDIRFMRRKELQTYLNRPLPPTLSSAISATEIESSSSLPVTESASPQPSPKILFGSVGYAYHDRQEPETRVASRRPSQQSPMSSVVDLRSASWLVRVGKRNERNLMWRQCYGDN